MMMLWDVSLFLLQPTYLLPVSPKFTDFCFLLYTLHGQNFRSHIVHSCVYVCVSVFLSHNFLKKAHGERERERASTFSVFII